MIVDGTKLRRERTRRKLLKGLYELADLFHRAIDLTDMVEDPVPVSAGSGGISAQVTWPVALTKVRNCAFVTGVGSIQKPSTVTLWTGASFG